MAPRCATENSYSMAKALISEPGNRRNSAMAAVACVNDDVCLSTRMYDRRENTFGIWSDTVGSEFANVKLCAPRTSEKDGVK